MVLIACKGLLCTCMHVLQLVSTHALNAACMTVLSLSCRTTAMMRRVETRLAVCFKRPRPLEHSRVLLMTSLHKGRLLGKPGPWGAVQHR